MAHASKLSEAHYFDCEALYGGSCSCSDEQRTVTRDQLFEMALRLRGPNDDPYSLSNASFLSSGRAVFNPAMLTLDPAPSLRGE